MAKIAQRIYEHYYFNCTEDRQFKNAKVQEIEVWLKENYADIEWTFFPQATAEIMLEWGKGRIAELDEAVKIIQELLLFGLGDEMFTQQSIYGRAEDFLGKHGGL